MEGIRNPKCRVGAAVEGFGMDVTYAARTGNFAVGYGAAGGLVIGAKPTIHIGTVKKFNFIRGE